MQSLNLIMCLLFLTININSVFGFPPFSSYGHEYEVNYSQEGKHMITNINDAEEEIITADETLSGYNTEFFTDEIEKYPDLLPSLEYTLADLEFLNKGDTQYFYIPSLPNNYKSINDKVNSNNEIKFPLDFIDDKNSKGKDIIIDYEYDVDDYWRPSLNLRNFYDPKNLQDIVPISKRDTYQITASPEYIFEEPDYTNYNNYMKQLEIDTQKEKENLNNSITQEEEKSQKSDKNPTKPIIEKSCDDGRTNLEVDWDGSKGDYECNADVEIPPNHLPSTLYCDPSASIVQPKTHCMNETLEYSELIPVIGDYRPIAPQLGEYKFIPKQRWLNSLDNNAVVLLYHPCAERSAINKLRLLIMKYYERYIFTPYNLEETAPFAIVVKGCRLVMSRVVPNEVAHFLQDHGPQKVPLGKPNDKKPKYNLGLIEKNRPHHLFGLIYQLT